MLGSTASAQSSSVNHRWTLLPGGFAKVPVQDLRYAAAYRIIEGERNLAAVLEAAARGREAEALREQIRAMEEKERLQAARIKPLADRNAQLEEDLMACARKRDGLRSWALIGKTAVGVCAVALGYTVYKSTLAP
jgi:hypothetical protein